MKKRLFGLFISFLVVLIAFGITASADTTDTTDEEIAEAIWGTSATDLGGEGRVGTLADALYAAYHDDTLKYIKLQTDVTNADLIDIDSNGRELTIDLAGHAISTESDISIFDIHSGNVTITSTARGAALNATYGGSTYGIRVVSNANVTVDNVYVTSTGNCIFATNGANVIVGESAILESLEYSVVNAQSNVTVKGTLIPRADGYAEIPISFDAVVDLSECKGKNDILIYFYETTLPLDELVILGEGEQLVNKNTQAPDEYPVEYDDYEIPLYYDVYAADAEGNKTKIDTVYKKSEYIAPAYEFTAPEGKVCIGWNTNDSELTPEVYVGDTFTVIDDVTLYPVFIDDAIYLGGVELPSGKYLAAGADTPTDTKPEGGYAYYEKGTLTLNGYTYTGLGSLFNTEELIYENEEDNLTLTYYALIYSEFSIKIKLIGKNALTSSYYATPEDAAVDTYYAGITLRGMSLDISGGTLTISAVNDGAINLTNGGDLTVTDATLTLNALEATLDSDGIDINGEGSFTVKNSTLAITTTEDAVELEDGGYVTITDSTVTITAGDDGIEIDEYGIIAIESSTLTAVCDYIPLKSDDGVYIIITDSALDLTSKESEGISSDYDVYVTDSDVKVNAKLIAIYTDCTFNCVNSTLAVTSAGYEGIFAYGAFIADSDVTVTSKLDALYTCSLIVTGESTRLSLTSETAAVSAHYNLYLDSGINHGYKVIDSTDPVGNPCYSLAGADGNAVKTLTITPKPVTPDATPDATPDTEPLNAGTAVLITVISLLVLEALAAAVVYVLVLKPRGITLKSLFGKKADTPAPTADGTDTDA